jgi:hypothetical protein
MLKKVFSTFQHALQQENRWHRFLFLFFSSAIIVFFLTDQAFFPYPDYETYVYSTDFPYFFYAILFLIACLNFYLSKIYFVSLPWFLVYLFQGRSIMLKSIYCFILILIAVTHPLGILPFFENGFRTLLDP